MAGFQTASPGNLILQRDRPSTPVVDISLVRPRTPLRLVFSPRQLRTDGERSHTTITNKLIAEIRSRREAGQSLRGIAVDLGVGDATVYNYARDILPASGHWHRGGRAKKVPLCQIERLRRAGFTYEEIAENFGVTKSAIHKRIKPCPSSFVYRNKPLYFRTFEAVERVTGIKAEEIRRSTVTVGGRAADDVGHARWIAAWLLVRRRGYSFHEAGKLLGGYDYSSISHMVERVDAKLKKLSLSHDKPMRALARALWAGEWPRRRSS